MKNPDSEFRKNGLKVIKTDLKQTLKNMTQLVLPYPVLRFIKYRPTDPDAAEFFTRVVKDTVNYREMNNVSRKDFLDLLIQIKNKGSVSDEDSVINTEGTLTIEEIAAQSLIFFVAGFETSSTTMHCAAYELAVNPDIQDRLREEIIDVLKKHDNILTYDAVADMKYLDRTVCGKIKYFTKLFDQI